MKKTILVVLMVLMVSTPCLAEVEPEGIISIEGTNWQTILVWTILPIPHFVPAGASIGFSGGVVYPCMCIGNVTNSFYIDMVAASFFMYSAEYTPPDVRDYVVNEVAMGIVQPTIGVGFMISYQTQIYFPIPLVYMALLIKTNDNWTPPSE
jgi:hypothetical protein